MKKLFAFIVAFSLAAGLSAQDCYTIKMNMKIEGLPAEYAGFGDQEMVNYLKGELYRSESTSMMGSSANCFDGKTHTALMDQMGNKSGYTAIKAEMDASNAEEKLDKPKIEYTGETKQIAGYECTKAVLTTVGAEGKETKVTMWVTEKIKSDAAKGRRQGGRMKMDFGELKGYPLQIETAQSQNGMDVKVMITATEVSTAPIEDSFFKLDTEGYTMMTFAQFKEAMKKPKYVGGK